MSPPFPQPLRSISANTPKMPRIRIVTDSNCDIPDSLVRQYDITIVPFRVALSRDSNSTLDVGNSEQLIRIMREDKSLAPSLTEPSVEEYTRLYRQLRETCDGVISIHTSAKLGDSYANAATARETFGLIGQGGPFPISVIDSLSVSMGLGWIVLAVARAAMTGLDLPKLTALTARLAGITHVAFFTESNEGLLRNGRATRLQSHKAGLQAMKPLFHLDEGQLSIYEKTRTRAKARDALYNFVEDFTKIGEIAIMHTDAYNEVEHLMTRVGAIYPRERVLIVQPGPAVTAWLGLDAVGVAVLEGEE